MIAKPETFVFDTNVLVSAILFRHSIPWRALVTALEHGRLLSSAMTQSELREVLSRPKFDRIAPLQARLEQVEAFLNEMLLIRTVDSFRICRDPRDDKFLELAVAGRADLIVTGDADLLALHPFRNIPILTPAAMLAFLGLGDTL